MAAVEFTERNFAQYLSGAAGIEGLDRAAVLASLEWQPSRRSLPPRTRKPR